MTPELGYRRLGIYGHATMPAKEYRSEPSTRKMSKVFARGDRLEDGVRGTRERPRVDVELGCIWKEDRLAARCNHSAGSSGGCRHNTALCAECWTGWGS